jgi:AcrR family transcriptional regulator
MGTRDDILAAASELLARHGAAGTSTRAVCAAAGVTAPTLYHHFGDKQRLLDAVVDAGFERYMAGKRAALLAGATAREAEACDPVENLRRGWDAHVAFGLAHPTYYTVMFARTDDERVPPAAMAAMAFLVELLVAVQQAGRLRMDIDLALQAASSAAHGLTSLRIAWPDAPWREELSITLREAMIAAVARPVSPDQAAPHRTEEDQ